jgi:hypothetical protein
MILAQELLDLGTYSATDLVRLGFQIGTLDGKGVAAAMAHYGRNASRLSFNNCVALTYAEQNACILLTGDGPLRALATNLKVEVHGLLWAADLIDTNRTCPADHLVNALLQLQADPSTRLPAQALAELIARLKLHK